MDWIEPFDSLKFEKNIRLCYSFSDFKTLTGYHLVTAIKFTLLYLTSENTNEETRLTDMSRFKIAEKAHRNSNPGWNPGSVPSSNPGLNPGSNPDSDPGLVLSLSPLHTNPSRKWSFSKTLLKPEEFENVGFAF